MISYWSIKFVKWNIKLKLSALASIVKNSHIFTESRWVHHMCFFFFSFKKCVLYIESNEESHKMKHVRTLRNYCSYGVAFVIKRANVQFCYLIRKKNGERETEMTAVTEKMVRVILILGNNWRSLFGIYVSISSWIFCWYTRIRRYSHFHWNKPFFFRRSKHWRIQFNESQAFD